MAVRRESVQLDLTGDYITRMGEAAAVTSLMTRRVRALDRASQGLNTNMGTLNTTLNSTNGNLGTFVNQTAAVQRGNQNLSRGLTQTTTNARSADRSINQLTGRLGLLADASLILGPGLVPIAAVGVTAIGGITAAVTAAAVAGGSAVVAFQGLGDAVSAVNEFQNDMTFANLEKAREAMKALGPDAQRFVVEFQKFRPVLSEIKAAAEEGWFPGLTESLDGFARLGPQIEDIFFKAGEAGGFLVDSAADSLSSERWQPFLEFIEAEVPTAMGSLARTMGDLTHGASELFMALDPSNDAFLGWLEDVADGFDKWAQSSEGEDAITGIMDYARENGPALADLFTSLVGALAAIVKAAAPLGGPVLTGLTAVADMVRVIAESDMATPLLAAVAAMRLFNRVSAVAVAARNRGSSVTASFTAPFGQQGNAGGFIGPLTPAQTAAQAAAQRRARLGAAARGGGAAVGVGLLASGAASNLGLTNTAMLTLAGTMAGPLGAAAGFAVGQFMDLTAANDAFEQSLDAANQTASRGDFGAFADQLAAVQKESAKLRKDADSLSLGELATGQFGLVNDLFGKFQADDAESGLDRLRETMRASQEAAAGLGEAMGMTVGPIDGSARSVAELNAALEAAKPAMDALGISQQDLTRAQLEQDAIAAEKIKTGSGRRDSNPTEVVRRTGISDTPADDLAFRVNSYTKYMDTAQAKADNFSAAMGRLAMQEGTAAERAGWLGEALSDMLDPTLDAEAALDKQRETLQQIKELTVRGGFSEKTREGRENRATTRQYVDDLKQRLVAMVAAGKGEEDLARVLGRSRQQFIQSGRAAGFSTKQMEARANAIGLTPKLVETTFRAVGITKFDRQVEALQANLKGIPKRLQSDIRTNGVPKTLAEVDSVVKRLKLTEGEREALIKLVGASQAEGAAFALSRALDIAARAREARITVTQVNRTIDLGSRGAGPRRADGTGADGTTVPKTGMPYADRHLYLLADGEEVISNRYGQADRNRGLLKAINAGRLAAGGTTRGGRSTAAYALGADLSVDTDSLVELAQAARSSARELKGEARERRQARREALKSKRSEFQSYASEAGSSLAGSLTGEGLAGFDLNNAAAGNDARRALRALATAKKKGLDGPLFNVIAGSGDLSLIEEFAALSAADIRRREQQYGATQAAQNALGNYAAEGRFGTTLASLDKQIKVLGQQVRNGAREGSREGARQGSREGSRGRARDVLTRTRTGR